MHDVGAHCEDVDGGDKPGRVGFLHLCLVSLADHDQIVIRTLPNASTSALQPRGTRHVASYS